MRDICQIVAGGTFGAVLHFGCNIPVLSWKYWALFWCLVGATELVRLGEKQRSK